MSRYIYHHRQARRKKSHKGRLFTLTVLALSVAGITYGGSSIFSKDSLVDVAAPAASIVHEVNTDLPKPELDLNWNRKSHAAIGALGYGVIDSSDNDTKPVPMASLSKVMAAILIIEQNDLSLENPGDDITFTDQDVALYNKYLLLGGVVTEVKNDHTISQLDALKAMLMRSSNNIADTATLATFGSLDAYLDAANAKAKELGMENTNFADIAGFSPKTVATASDLILLGEYAMANPLFSDIVSTWETTIRGNEKITNINVFLDFEGNGVLGIKTGLTDEAGGTYMTASRFKTKSGDDVVALAVTLGEKTHFDAQEKAMPLLKTVQKGFNQ